MSQKVREAVYDILQQRIVGAAMLDLFCGSGSVGIEGLSRGARHVDFVDRDTGIVSVNVKSFGLDHSASVYRRDALTALEIMHKKSKSYDIVFVGAPYAFERLLEVVQTIDRCRIVNPDGTLIVEHRKGVELPREYTEFHHRKTYRYGQTFVGFYESVHGQPG